MVHLVGLSERDESVKEKMKDVYRRVEITNKTAETFERAERECVVLETPVKVTVTGGSNSQEAGGENDRWCTGISMNVMNKWGHARACLTHVTHPCPPNR